MKLIKEVKVDDYVWLWDHAQHKAERCRITKVAIAAEAQTSGGTFIYSSLGTLASTHDEDLIDSFVAETPEELHTLRAADEMHKAHFHSERAGLLKKSEA